MTRPLIHSIQIGGALLAVALAVTAKLLIDAPQDEFAPTLLFHAAVVLSAYFGGVGSYAIAIVASAGAVGYLYLPQETLSSDISHQARFILFIAEISLTGAVVLRLRRANRKLDDQRHELQVAYAKERAAHEQLERTERQNSDMLSTISDSFFAVDREGNVTFVNAGAAEMLGQSPERLQGGPLDRSSPETAEMHELLVQAIQNNAPSRFERFHPAINRWIEHQTYPTSDGGTLAYGRDVTARRRLEEALRTSEERFSRLSEASMVGIAFARGPYINEANEMFLRVVGYTRDDLLMGKLKWADMTPSECRHQDKAAIQQAAEMGFCTPYEKEFIRKDGSHVPVLIGSTRVDSLGKDAPVDQWESLAIVLDITERKRSDQRLRLLVEGSKLLISSLDYEKTLKALSRFVTDSLADWCVIYTRENDNLRRAAMTHKSPAGQVLLKALGEFTVEPKSVAPLANVLQRGVTEIALDIDDQFLAEAVPQAEHRAAIARLSPRSFVAVPIPARGRIVGAMLLVSNRPHAYNGDDLHLIEELGRRAGVALENARLFTEAQEANRLKDDFITLISHELRTPLTPILGATYMLRSEPQDKRIVSRAIDLIERNAKAQARIVEDLLDVSRIINGKLRLSMEPVEMEPVIRSAVETVQAACEAKRIKLDLRLQPVKRSVYGDPDRLQQVIWNLLANAVKFTPNDGQIVLEVEERETHAEIRVADTGIGIGADFLPYVFDRFRQEDSSRTRVHGGLGLGLAIVRHLVEAHGGTVHAESSGDFKGSTFIIRLPLRLAIAGAVNSLRGAS